MVIGRLIYTACRKLFYTICHICITNVQYHRRLAWTRLNNHRRGLYLLNSFPHFRTPSDWYVLRNSVTQYDGFRIPALQLRHIQLPIYDLSQWTVVMTFHHTRHMLDSIVWENALFRRSIKLGYQAVIMDTWSHRTLYNDKLIIPSSITCHTCTLKWHPCTLIGWHSRHWQRSE